jgi:phosphoglycerate dehydrogenase-like enzyme
MKLVIHPPIDAGRLAKVREAAGAMQVVNDTVEALREIAGADAFFGKITPELLAAARRLRWVQSPTASLEHYVFPELISHPCVLTNMRGLFSDVIADQVLGYILCFARNLHLYIRRQAERRWEPVAGSPDVRSSRPAPQPGFRYRGMRAPVSSVMLRTRSGCCSSSLAEARARLSTATRTRRRRAGPPAPGSL